MLWRLWVSRKTMKRMLGEIEILTERLTESENELRRCREMLDRMQKATLGLAPELKYSGFPRDIDGLG